MAVPVRLRVAGLVLQSRGAPPAGQVSPQIHSGVGGRGVPAFLATSAPSVAKAALRNSPLRGSDSPRFIRLDDERECAPKWQKMPGRPDRFQSLANPSVISGTDAEQAS